MTSPFSSSNMNGLTNFNAFADRLAATKVLDDYNFSRCPRVLVEGYDTSLGVGVIRCALLKHFDSCGGLIDVVIDIDPVNGGVQRFGFIYFLEESAKAKALALSGRYMGGWKVYVTDVPKKVCVFTSADVAHATRLVHSRQCGFAVTGYDTSLPADHVRETLFRHFSSCGEIIYLTVEEDPTRPGFLKRSGFIRLLGVDALEKSLRLSGTDLGGWNVVVETLPPPNPSTRFPTLGFPPGHSYGRVPAANSRSGSNL